MKKLLVMLLAALLALGCLTAVAETEETVITVATWQNSILMEEMLERFNETHPGIKAVTHELNGAWFDHTALLECAASGTVLETLPLERYRSYSELFGEDLYGCIALETCMKRRTSLGGTAPEREFDSDPDYEALYGADS